MKSGIRGATRVFHPRYAAVHAPIRLLSQSTVLRQIDQDDLAGRVKALLNPPSSSTAIAKPNVTELQAFIAPLLQAEGPDQAGTILDRLERGIRDSGFDGSDLPTPLASALETLRKQAGTTLSGGSAEHPSHLSNSEQRGGQLSDRVDTGRLYARLRQCVDKGDSSTLQAIWSEHKDRLMEPSSGEKFDRWRDEMMSKILSACLRCERRFKSASLKSTIADITSSAPKPLPTDIINVILAHRADVGESPGFESGEEGNEAEARGEEGKKSNLDSLRSAWNMASEQGARRDVRSYMIYMEGLARSGDLDGLQETWRALLDDTDLKKREVGEPHPPVAAFNHMLSSSFLIPKTGPPVALELFDRAVQSGTPSINIVTINTVLRHYARVADIQSMTSLFTLAGKQGLKPDVVTYTTLVQGLLRADRVEMAKNVLSKMLSEGLEPNERMCSLLVSDLARSGSQAGLQRAEEMMSEMRRKGMTVTQVTWTSLISGYFRGGWESDAWSAIERMGRSRTKLNRVGYNMILKQGQGGWCLKVFQRMISEGVLPNSDTFFIVLAPLVRKKQWVEADWVVREMRRLGYRPDKGALGRLVSRVEARQ